MKQDAALKAKLRRLREQQTPAEQKRWLLLRAKRFEAVKFSRQVPIGSYIADFAARSHKLVVELDGDTHGRQVEYDARRTAVLGEPGYRVLRFTNADVMGNPEGVLTAMADALGVPLSPTPFPASGARG